MTARSDDPGVSPGTSAAAGGEIWGTWEELLLACAVRRHGTDSWDSVAMEVQSRCPAAAASRLTPTGCRLRFRLLHRRFAGGGAEKDGGDEDPDAAAAEEWVEELRKLRVAELRREVERYDLSIGSLQSKVKRLKEERERSISGEANPPSVKAEEEDEEEEPAEGKGSLEEDAAGGEDRVSGGESGRSCKESNSSDLKRPAHDAGAASAAGDGAAAAREEEEDAAARESLDVKREQVSGESVAGSKEADKESSDVQSSASPSRRRGREGGGGCGGGGEEAEAEAEAEAEEASASPSACAALPAAEAEALLAFLESVRTSKPGSVFERRLESQDDTKYGSLIKRHVDLETIRSKLEAGGNACYGSASEFYRDLLLLCANALVFFPRGSPEHAAAARTRALVSKHMAASLSKDQPGTSGKSPAAPPSKKAKAEADVGSLLEKTAPIIVCRKRSSIAKAAAAASKEEKVDKGETDKEEEENEAGKKKKAGVAKDKARGLRTNKTRAAPVKKAAPNQKKGDKGSDSDTPAEGTKKPDKKGGTGAAGSGAAVAKKRNAVNFLNRMKQGSAPSTERVSLLETLKLSAAAEQKKAGKGSEGKKETAGGSGSKRGTPPGRRNVGRPPKRAAAPPSPPPAKRGRGGGGKRGGKK
ncbi:hypothetical protein HU200_041371 [Digitaria exilis]|uniref:Bromo domain-containing protein n=1 Tax=Digitaria exilis TaxID=1010633 RepID=A0A835B8X5_9POAL|nr:hypothetical protein HU200_041371 [Digitaria exilis]CAB3483447.1 unnamed protein product [Digitaria exilis]